MFAVNHLIGFGAGGAFTLNNSADYDGSTGYLSRTPASASNRKTWQWASWVKRGSTGTEQTLFYAPSPATFLRFDTSNRLDFAVDGGASFTFWRTTDTYTSTTAWVHVKFTLDTTQAVKADRFALEVNGAAVALTNWSEAGYGINFDSGWNNTVAHYIGRGSSGAYFDGLMSQTAGVDGATGDTFYDAGPVDISGLTFGTNGFHCDYEASGDLGNDVSGNNNDWTKNGTITQSTDVPP